MVHLGHLELFSRDTRALARLYRDVLGATFVSDQDPCFWVAFGEREILIRPGFPIPSATYQQTAIALVLYTNDLPETLRQLGERGLCPRSHDLSPDCPTFQDPDGNWIQIVDPGNLNSPQPT